MRLGWCKVGLVSILLWTFGSFWAHAMGASTGDSDTETFSASLHPSLLVRSLQRIPSEREQPHPLDRALYLSIAGYRTFDYLSTQHAIAKGAREVVLPQWVVSHDSTFMAFEGAASAVEVSGSIWLIRHRHRRMARAMNVVSIGVGVNTVLHNYNQAVWSPVTAGR